MSESMAVENIVLPKMGEGVAEATIIKWLKKEGDTIETEDVIVEIATDKVDTEVTSPFSGKLLTLKFKEGDVVQVGIVIAEIETEGKTTPKDIQEDIKTEPAPLAPKEEIEPIVENMPPPPSPIKFDTSASDKFYSPLVKSIAKKEGLSISELDKIQGTGKEGRLTKKDLLGYLSMEQPIDSTPIPSEKIVSIDKESIEVKATSGGQDEIIEMDRVRQIIASHMVESKNISAHVTSIIEADVTNIVNWRNEHKDAFQKTHGEPLTFTPIFIEALVKTIQQFPMINSSLDGNNIILKKNINIGMATALPTGNLVVPVIKNADHLNLRGLIKKVNDLAQRAKDQNLSPDDTVNGTYTITNIGSFGNIIGTPIINQPQVAIMAVGAITKKPVVIETENGDTIGIRHMMYLSHTYDHRIIDGALGSKFLKVMADHLEIFNTRRKF